MAADRNTPEGVENWLIQSSTIPWSFPSIVGPELTREILQHICNRWSSYPSNIKLGILFALLCIRKLLLSSMGNELTAIITNGCNDSDEWVRLVSKMLQNYPSTSALDLNIEQHIPQDAQVGLQNLMERIQQTGIKFHPTEYAFIDRDISDAFSTLSINAEAVRTSTSHFILRQGTDMSRQQRLYTLNNVAVPPPSPGLTSPVNATGFNFMSDPNRIGPTANSTPSLFIPKRRPSQLVQPFHRPPNPQKPGPTNTSRGSLPGSTQGPDSPTEPKITLGKKYVKPTKIQILDITTATTITRNQEETKLKTQMEEQQMKEARKQEREKQKEEKRREEEEKKKQKEREKNERARQKEEIRLAKEKEKREKAAAKAAAAAPNETSDAQPTNVPDDETIEEEIVSDGELPHKDPKKTASPISSLSSTNPYQPEKQFPSTNNHNTIITSQNGSNSDSTNMSVMQTAITEPPSSVSEQPMAADLELPRSQFEEIPRNEMNEALRKQFEMNCGAVLDRSNKILGDNRQLIINFLGGHHTKPEQREKLMSISSGVTCNEDEIRHIILHEEKTPIPNEGKEIQETFIFEMNLSNGQWRKLKRKKTKAVKNPNLEALNGRPNGRFPGR